MRDTPPTRPTDKQRDQSRRLAAWHTEWVHRYLDDAEFAPAGRKAGSDYNQHYLDVEASPEVEAEFAAGAARALRG